MRQQMCSPTIFCSSKKKKKKLEVEDYLLIICQWGGVYGERVSAFLTCFNLSFSYIQFGYFLSYLLYRTITTFWISLRWELMHVQLVTHSVHGWKVGGFCHPAGSTQRRSFLFSFFFFFLVCVWWTHLFGTALQLI